MRRYTFTNWVLSSIQQGIQAGHAGDELFLKYSLPSAPAAARDALWDWAKHHKTYVLLNGGDYRAITEIALFLQRNAEAFSFPAPWASFNEDERSLGGLMTSVAIVLPERVYDAKFYEHFDAYVYSSADGSETATYQRGTADFDFITILKSCSLAR